jgi:hypothetical protein
MPLFKQHAMVFGLALAAASFSSTSFAAEQDFLSRFEGSFSGGGMVQRNAKENPNQVTCTMTGQPSATTISMSGKCGAFIFSKQISAKLRFDPASGRYTGTYTGSSIGPAKLSGKRQGDSIVLIITWPQPVNGDTKATMIIRNSGNGSLAITVTDELEPGGGKKAVTQIALSQS